MACRGLSKRKQPGQAASSQVVDVTASQYLPILPPLLSKREGHRLYKVILLKPHFHNLEGWNGVEVGGMGYIYTSDY